MDERSEDLRDLFVETTGAEEVTERQRDDRGSLLGDADEAAVRAVVERMRDRYEFRTDLGTDALVRVAAGFFDGASDAEIADELAAADVADAAVDAETVFRARMDLHLVCDGDRDAPFALDALRDLVAEGADDEACAAALDAGLETVVRYRRVVASELAARRVNERFRDAFADLLTDAPTDRLADAAREDGLREAAEDIETDVSF
ncbi:MAG: conditioned medium-induced protein 4 [Haloferacaceae archaeon]